MSKLAISFDNVVDLQLFPTKEEVQLKIVGAETHTSDNGNTSLHVMFKHAAATGYVTIHEYLGLPKDTDGSLEEAEVNDAKLRKLKRFFQCFNIPPALASAEWEDMQAPFVGHIGFVECKTETDPDGEYEPKSRIAKFIVNK